MFKKCKNTKMQGNIGVGIAIAYFTKNNYIVSLPINDSQSYDLIVDINNQIHRVQVKTTSSKTKYEIFKVALRTTGGNQSFNSARPFEQSGSDLLFVLCENGVQYLIPTKDIDNTNSLNLGADKEKYII